LPDLLDYDTNILCISENQICKRCFGKPGQKKIVLRPFMHLSIFFECAAFFNEGHKEIGCEKGKINILISIDIFAVTKILEQCFRIP
jgi:hypothetical protein